MRKSEKLNEKYGNLKRILSSMRSVLLAYSGGVDSTFLLKVSKDALKEKVLAVTADSPIFPSREIKFAKHMAKKLKVEHAIIESKELDNADFVKNDRERCYWCKKELFSELKNMAKREKINHVVDGSNFDDRKDYRPGSRAAKEFKVKSPLQEARLTKSDIRKLSHELRLPTWNKPSFACLSSRFSYGIKIEEDTLKRIDEAENILRRLGFKQVRVRHHGDIARIEVPEKEIKKLMREDVRKKALSRIKKLNYPYIAVDMAGYRSGSMNKTLRRKK